MLSIRDLTRDELAGLLSLFFSQCERRRGHSGGSRRDASAPARRRLGRYRSPHESSKSFTKQHGSVPRLQIQKNMAILHEVEDVSSLVMVPAVEDLAGDIAAGWRPFTVSSEASP